MIGAAALALWSTRRVSRKVLTLDDVSAVLGWPLALAAVERRARTMDALAVAMVAVDGGGR